MLHIYFQPVVFVVTGVVHVDVDDLVADVDVVDAIIIAVVVFWVDIAIGSAKSQNWSKISDSNFQEFMGPQL